MFDFKYIMQTGLFMFCLAVARHMDYGLKSEICRNFTHELTGWKSRLCAR